MGLWTDIKEFIKDNDIYIIVILLSLLCFIAGMSMVANMRAANNCPKLELRFYGESLNQPSEVKVENQ